MVLDNSALIAVPFREPEAHRYARCTYDANRCRMSDTPSTTLDGLKLLGYPVAQ